MLATSHLKSLLKGEGRSGAQGSVCRVQGRLQLPSTALELPQDQDKQECVLHLVLLWLVLVSMNTGLTKEPMAIMTVLHSLALGQCCCQSGCDAGKSSLFLHKFF